MRQGGIFSLPGNPGDPPEKPKAEPPPVPLEEETPALHRAEVMQNDLYEQLGESRTDSFANSFINGLSLADDDLEGRLEKFGQENGIIEAGSTAHQVYDQYQAQAVDYVSKKTGEDGMKILEWARGQFDLESWQQVTRLHFFGRNMNGYDAIISEYNKQTKKG